MLRIESDDVADIAPSGPELTNYDLTHGIVYLRLLDAAAEGADWQEVSRIVLKIDPDAEPRRAKASYDSHCARARWMTQQGYKELLKLPNV